MSDVIFARTRHEYGSYVDLWKLVQLSGYRTCYVDEIESDSLNTYVFTPSNGETVNGWPGARARIIHWQLEWVLEAHQTPPGVAEVWTMDAELAERIGARYVPIGSHPDLNVFRGHESQFTKVFDVIHLAYQNGRRAHMTDLMGKQGFELAPTHDLWENRRSTALLASKLMVHTHQWENQRGVAGLRWAIAAAHHLPLLSETVVERGFFQPRHFAQADYDFLPVMAGYMLRDEQILKDYAAALYDWLCVEWTFKKVVERAL
jgi:hypothetical protein